MEASGALGPALRGGGAEGRRGREGVSCSSSLNTRGSSLNAFRISVPHVVNIAMSSSANLVVAVADFVQSKAG